MTLIIGVRCHDSVVIGADSAATFASAGGAETIRQATHDKVEVVHDKALIGVSGSVGFAQTLCGTLGEVVARGKLPKQASTRVKNDLQAAFKPSYDIAWAHAAAAAPALGQAAGFSVLSSVVVAAPADGGPTLFEFDKLGQAEEKTAQLPFVAIGSGQQNADPILGFLKAIFWQEGVLPSLADGIFATLWALQDCIRLSPGGVGDPIHLYTLQAAGAGAGGLVARELDRDVYLEAEQDIEDAKNKLKRFRDLVAVETEPERPPE